MHKLILIATLVAPAAAHAQDQSTGPADAVEERGGERPTGGSAPNFVALGAGFAPDYIGADKYQVIPFGAFRLKTPVADLQTSGLSLNADLLAPYQRENRTRFELGAQANFRFGRLRDVDDARVRALGRISNTVEVGGFAGLSADDALTPGDTLSVRFEALKDVGDVYDGWTYGAEASYSFATPREWGAQLVVNTQYGGQRFHDRYFTVTPAGSVASGFAPFRAEEGFYQVAGGLNLRRSLSRRWFVAGQFVVARLIGDAADSPIVREAGSRTQLRGGVGVGLTF
jgi:outer membrane protein